jgi:octaprenyl-diphosphate synthase
MKIHAWTEADSGPQRARQFGRGNRRKEGRRGRNTVAAAPVGRTRHHFQDDAATSGDYRIVISEITPSFPTIMTSVASLAATADIKSHAFADAFALLAPHMAELDQFMHGQLATFEPEIRAAANHCMAISGKRIRPALVFLGGWRGPDEIAPELVRAAAVVELVHLATFVHDDIMDEVDVRRSRRTTSRESGPTPAVLLGDALFAHGLHLASQFPTTEVCAAITESARRVCAGEIMQTLRSTRSTRAEYQRIVDLKTADFFRVSCFLGARLAGSEPGYVDAASRFGRHLGIAWQIHDDLADIFGEEARIGKTPGTDLASGKLTLPLLALLERLPATEADALRAEIVGARPPQLALRLRQMRALAIFPVVAEAVHAELAAAADTLREWPGHPPTPLLLGLCDGLRAQVAGLRPAGAA